MDARSRRIPTLLEPSPEAAISANDESVVGLPDMGPVLGQIVSAYLRSHAVPRSHVAGLIYDINDALLAARQIAQPQAQPKPTVIGRVVGTKSRVAAYVLASPPALSRPAMPDNIRTQPVGVLSLQVRAARALVDLSQLELADLAGVGLSMIGALERNLPWTRRSPSAATVVKALMLQGVEFVSASNGHGAGIKVAPWPARAGRASAPTLASHLTRSLMPGRLVRAGRELLQWSQADLAKPVGCTVQNLVAFEKLGQSHSNIDEATRAVLMRNGIVFLNTADENVGVCLRR